MLLHRRLGLAALVAGTLAVSAFALAQERDQPQPRRSDSAPADDAAAQPERRDAADRNAQRDANTQRNANAQRETAADASRGDAQLAACLIISNQKEVALARFAQQQAQDAGVKEFAQQMIQDHEQFAAELQKFADKGGYQESQLAVKSSSGERGTANRNQPGAVDQDATQPRRSAREPQLDPNNPDAAQPAGDQASLDFVSIKQQIAQECLQSAEKELSEKQESEFDRCYIGSQVFAHMEMVDTLKVFQQHASPELQAVLQKGSQTAQQHLDHAKQLAQQLEKAQGTTGNEREGTSPRRPNANERPNSNERPDAADRPDATERPDANERPEREATPRRENP